MFRKTMLAGVVVAIALLVPGAAVAQQSLSLNIGYFALKGEDSRVADDVMLENLNYHVFKVSDFNGATVGGEWLIPVGRIFEVGVGVGYYQRNVPTVYADYVNEDGSEIEQDFKLRVVPVTGIVRFLPTGRGSAIQPYIGAGIGVLSWRSIGVGGVHRQQRRHLQGAVRGEGDQCRSGRRRRHPLPAEHRLCLRRGSPLPAGRGGVEHRRLQRSGDRPGWVHVPGIAGLPVLTRPRGSNL